MTDHRDAAEVCTSDGATSARLGERAAILELAQRLNGGANMRPRTLVDQQAPHLLHLIGRPLASLFGHRREGTT